MSQFNVFNLRKTRSLILRACVGDLKVWCVVTCEEAFWGGIIVF